MSKGNTGVSEQHRPPQRTVMAYVDTWEKRLLTSSPLLHSHHHHHYLLGSCRVCASLTSIWIWLWYVESFALFYGSKSLDNSHPVSHDRNDLFPASFESVEDAGRRDPAVDTCPEEFPRILIGAFGNKVCHRIIVPEDG